MGIRFEEKGKTITLHTKNTSYQMKVNEFGVLLHNYYGKRIQNDDMSYLNRTGDVGFSPAMSDAGNDRRCSLDFLMQEYSTSNMGDFRNDCMNVRFEDGTSYSDFRYDSHSIRKGKYSIPALPAMTAEENEAETLEIKMLGKGNRLVLTLYYAVFEDLDVITRSARLENREDKTVELKKALSVCLDMPDHNMDMITLCGRHAMERQVQRQKVEQGIYMIESRRGTSSHQYNPFLMLSRPDTTEVAGDCFGSCLVYSGNFEACVEGTQLGQLRLTMGIGSRDFSWKLQPGEAFYIPEVMLSFSDRGFGQLSRQFHRAMRNNLCQSPFNKKRRPILINNWEATYFKFTGEKLIEIARNAAELGIEMLVMDDGWFGKREDDNSGLGDWTVNEEKLGMPLRELASRVNDLGMEFGIWFEPEMVSEDSELFRQHPDWALVLPGKEPNRGRNQLVLDMTRQEVRDYLFEHVCQILDSAHITYVKWDMNRSLSDVYSSQMSADRQGEVQHRYVLGLYELLARITKRYPEILFEGCSGGGGRFDAGMLYYHPQIWCSDNTESIDRLKIQYGTSFAYPVSTVGSHVSAVPNHQNGRITSLETRGIVAMSGTFGYELDISRMTSQEKEEVQKQVEDFKKYYSIIQNGDYYRLSSPFTDDLTAWQFVSEDGSHVLLNVVVTEAKANSLAFMIKMQGLKEEDVYCDSTGKCYSGSALMYAGYVLEDVTTEYKGFQILFEKVF